MTEPPRVQRGARSACNAGLGRYGLEKKPTLLEAKFFSDVCRRKPGLALVFGSSFRHQLGKFLVLGGAPDFDSEILAVANVKPVPLGDGRQYKPLTVG